jgi:hypothetical protein
MTIFPYCLPLTARTKNAFLLCSETKDGKTTGGGVQNDDGGIIICCAGGA